MREPRPAVPGCLLCQAPLPHLPPLLMLCTPGPGQDPGWFPHSPSPPPMAQEQTWVAATAVQGCGEQRNDTRKNNPNCPRVTRERGGHCHPWDPADVHRHCCAPQQGKCNKSLAGRVLPSPCPSSRGSSGSRLSRRVSITPNPPRAGMGDSRQSKTPGCFYTLQLHINKSRSLCKM